MRGKLVHEDIGPGTWVLEGDDGERYTLTGTIPAELAGSQVEVEGQVQKGVFGISMLGGPTVAVHKIRKA